MHPFLGMRKAAVALALMAGPFIGQAALAADTTRSEVEFTTKAEEVGKAI
jgi:hypothetical protein